MAEFARIFAALLALYLRGNTSFPSLFSAVTPSATATRTRTVTARPTSSPLPPSPVPTSTATPPFTVTRTTTATPTASLTASATNTPIPTFTNTAIPTNTPVPTRPPAPTAVSVQPDLFGATLAGTPPAQKLASAFLIYPLIRASATQDTRIELMNLSAATVSLQCFYVTGVDCNEVGFFLSLTGSQPVAWKASTGMSGNGARLAPPFTGEGELKCVVAARSPDLASHNALQGRALLSDISGQTIGYNASAFRRLSPGVFSGEVDLDGVTYEQCPDRLHFNALSSRAGSDSEIVLVPCSEDLVNQRASTSTIQYAVINEFEQQFSASTPLSCFEHRRFSTISALRKSATGTDNLHVIVRSIDVPVVGLVIDKFTVPGSAALSVSSNEPYLDGGRSAIVYLP